MAAPILPNEKSSLTLSSYELVPDSKEKPSKLGTGSFACVRLAREKKSGKHFALKIINLNPEKLSKADLYYLRTEIQIHRQLDHPNVVKFHGYAQEGFKLYFALDYAEKGNLYTYIQNNKVLTPNEVFNFFYQTCLAVQYIHENNVMHRDIKPENILIDKDLNIKLCDFGWSARNIRDKRTTLCGTYEYMAPEIVWKKPYDYRIDIWSLGVLLYELIHREAPYKGRSLAEITESFKKPLLSFARDIQPEVKDLIQKILKIDAEERISISDILSHTWVKYHLMKREYSQRIANASSSSSNVRAKTAESSLSPRFKQNFYMNQLQIGSKLQQKDKDKSMCLPLNMTQPQQEQSRDDSPMLLPKSAAATPRVLQADRSMVMDRSVVIEKKVVVDKSENIMQQSKTLATTESESNLTTSISYLNTSYSEKALGYSSSTLPKKLAEKWAETTKNSNDPAGNRRLFQKDIMSPDFNTKLNGILQQLNASVANRKHLSMMSGILSPQSQNQNQNQDKGTQLNVTFLQNSRESRGIRQALTKENNHNMTCDFSNIQLDSYKVKYNAGRGASRFNLNNSNLRLDTIQSNAEPSLNSSITTLKANFIGRQKAETTKASYQKYFAFESGLSSQKTNESYLSRTALDSTLDSSMLSFSKRPRGEGYSSPFSSGNELHRKLTLKLDNSISYKAPTGVQSTKNKENKVEFFRAQSLMENLLSQR